MSTTRLPKTSAAHLRRFSVEELCDDEHCALCNWRRDALSSPDAPAHHQHGTPAQCPTCGSKAHSIRLGVMVEYDGIRRLPIPRFHTCRDGWHTSATTPTAAYQEEPK